MHTAKKTENTKDSSSLLALFQRIDVASMPVFYFGLNKAASGFI